MIAEHALISATCCSPPPSSHRDRFQRAQIGSGSEHVAIRRNLIQGGNGSGITLGSITLVAPLVIFLGKARQNASSILVSRSTPTAA